MNRYVSKTLLKGLQNGRINKCTFIIRLLTHQGSKLYLICLLIFNAYINLLYPDVLKEMLPVGIELFLSGIINNYNKVSHISLLVKVRVQEI